MFTVTGTTVARKPRSPIPSGLRPLLLCAKEVARMLSVDVRTLYRLERAGKVPAAMRFGRKLIRWRCADLEDFLYAHAGEHLSVDVIADAV